MDDGNDVALNFPDLRCKKPPWNQDFLSSKLNTHSNISCLLDPQWEKHSV